MLPPSIRFTFAVCAWLFPVYLLVTQDHHGGQLLALLSIVFALAAVVPKRELHLKVGSQVLRAADFLACAYLLVLVLLVGFAFIQTGLKFYGAL